MLTSPTHTTVPNQSPKLGFAGLFEALEHACESERAKVLADLREQVQAGRYRPNLAVVAERLLVDLGRHRP